MSKDLKEMYRTMVHDPFPETMQIIFGEGDGSQALLYEKVTWEIGGERRGLRYGENPDQPASMYKLINGNLVLGEVTTISHGQYLLSDTELLQSGKHPGKINITDADNALNILRYFQDRPTAVVVKHNNPCGVARADSLEDAYRRAFLADRVAAFGGCVALNRPVDKATALAIMEEYAEVVVAPEFEEGVMEAFSKRKNLRVMRILNMHNLSRFLGKRFLDLKSLMDGGIIAQISYHPAALKTEDLYIATCTYNGKEYRINRPPTPKERVDMIFGWLVESGITSNSVIYVKDETTVGIGTGEQDRVGVAQIARDKAYRKLSDRYCFEGFGIPFNKLKDKGARDDIEKQVREERGGLTGSSMISDAFFPFRDGVDVGIEEGVSAVLQPGGSMNDYQSIEACNEAQVTMMFTGQRSFKH